MDGTEIDVSVMSTRISLKFAAFQKKYNLSTDENEISKDNDELDPEMVSDMVEILSMIFQKSNKKLTADWILDNLELPVLLDMLKTVFNPMIERMAKVKPPEPEQVQTSEGDPEKN